MTAARGGPPANAALRGGLLIVVAVLVGALLLSRGFSEDGGVVAADGDTTETTVADTDGDTTDTPEDETSETTVPEGDGGTTDETQPAPEARPNEETKFIVLNGTTTNGAASSLSSQLSALGYVPGGTGNVSGGAPTSGIYYAEGWQPEAVKMAGELGVGAELAVPLPAPFEWDMGDSTILVVVGTDGLIAPT